MARSIGAAARAVLALVSLTVTASAGAQALPVLAPCTREFDPKVFLAGGQAIAIDLPSLRAIPTQGDALIAGFPLSPEMSADLIVHRIVPVTSKAQFVVVGKGGRESEVVPGEMHFFGGSIVGVPGSSAFLSVTDAGVFGWVQSEEARFIVSSGPMTAPHTPAVFDMASEAFSQIAWTPFMCGANELLNAGGLGQQDAPPPSSTLLPTCRSIDIAIDTDQEFLATFGGNATAALGYVETLVAGTDEIYRRDLSLQLRISYSRFWSTTDPWTQPDSGTQLDQFVAYWNANMGSVSRDVAHLFSPRNLGGGVAYPGAICNPSYGYGVCGDLTGSFPTPLVDHSSQNYDIIVFSHELGHNCGATHTHDTCPPADQCPPAAYFGPCQTAQVCSSSGTIMSYCHLCNGGDANIVLNFHSASRAQIASYMSSATCATSVNCSSNPACVLTISSAGTTIPATGGSQGITVTTVGPGCAWTPVSVPSWITVTNPGPASGNGTFAYTVQANTTYSDRSATLQIGDLTHTVTQLSALDCNANGISDTTEIAGNPALDCNGDGVLNSCEISEGAADCDGNGVPDACQVTTTVRAWGAGAAGTSGGVNYGQSTVPSTLGPAKYIGAGANHSLAVQFDGKVIGWGYNGYGQVNIPATLPNALAVTGGGNHSVALVLGGAVVCWGLNSDGQCNVPGDVGTTIAIAAGNAHTVALRSNHTVACWGANASGQSTVPAGLVNVTAISAGSLNTLALGSTGAITGWGHNVYGQSTPPAGLTNVTAIASGAVHSIALRNDGTMTCWGNNTFAQCTVPSDIGVVQKVFAGGYVTIALRTDGTVRMWGRNDYGQATPPAGIANDRMLAAGTSHTLTLESVSTLADCDHDGIPDGCEIRAGAADCDHNGVPDSCDIAAGAADANGNGVLDVCEIASGSAAQWGTSNGGNGHWYSRIDNSLSWDAAEAAAEAKGGTLVTITSQAEGVFIHNFVAPAMNFWAGGRRISGLWQWVTGEAWSYEAWNCQQCHPSCQPDNQGEDWLEAMCWDGSSIRWNNYTSSNGRPSYVIEWSADCNHDGMVDYGQIRSGQLADTNANGIPDSCENTSSPCDGGNPSVPNDCMRNATVVTGDATITFSNVGCNTDGPTHPALTCESGNDVFLNDIWYRVQATANGTMRVSTCNHVNFDSKLAVYGMGTNPATFDYSTLGAAFIACNDDGSAACQVNALYASELSVTVSAGNWYLIRVAAYATPGSGSVTIDMPEPCALPAFTGLETETCGTNTNNGCNGGGTQAITAGARIKGTLWANGGVRDVDYYSINVTGELAVTAKVYSASLVTCQILGGDISAANCSGLTVLRSGSGTCPTEVTTCLRAGTYYIAVANTQVNGNPCGNGVLNEYVLAVDTAPALCPVLTSTSCAAPGPNTATVNSSSAVDYGVARCVNEPAFPSCSSGGSRANSYARSFPAGTVRGALSCVTFGVWSTRRVGNSAYNGCTLVDSDTPLPAKVGIYRDLDGGAPRNKIAASGDGNDLELIAERDVLIPGSHNTQTLSFTPPICIESAANYSLVVVVDFPNLADGSTGIPADSGYQLLAGGNSAGGGSQTYARLSCADNGQYRLMENIDPTLTETWYVALNGDWSSCAGVSDCNGDGISDVSQIRAGKLADFNGNLIPDCCEHGTACTSDNYPVQWRTADGGNGHWYYRLNQSTAAQPYILTAAAAARGAHLLTISSAGENTFVASSLGASLLGFYSASSFQDFYWLNGEPVVFTNWGGWNCGVGPYPNDLCENRFAMLGSDCDSYSGLRPSWDDACFAIYSGYGIPTHVSSFIIEWSADCNNDGIVDYGQILNGQLADANANGVPDSCEVATADCNHDGVADAQQIRTGKLADFDSNLIPDCCEHGTACTIGNYPVQWRTQDGGNGHWYQFNPTVWPWASAMSVAQSRGGYGATVTSNAENNFIFALLTPCCNAIWLGGRGVDGHCTEPGQYYWLTGEPMGFMDWGVGEPSGWPGSNNCALSFHPGYSTPEWNDVPISDTFVGPSLIEWSADCNNDGIVDYGQILSGQLADTNNNGVPDSCDLGPNDCNHDGILDADQIRAGQLADFDSDLIPDCCERGESCVLGNYPVQWRIEDGGDGTWYKVDTTARAAVSSKDAAVSAGGHLAIIRSVNENTVIQRLVAAQAGTNSAWIGGYQDFASPSYSEPAGGWKWVDGTPIAGYTNWDTATGAPNNAGGFQEDWVEMLPAGTWNDARRALTRPMVIEWEADCNNDGIVDYGQILNGQLADTNHNGVPDLCEGPPADLNHDGRVDATDLALLLGNWGLTNAVGDINHDGVTNATDLALLLGSWS